jgi:hypothetical protein
VEVDDGPNSDQSTSAYAVQQVPEAVIREQRAAYNALLQTLGSATAEEIAAVLDEREPAKSEAVLTPEVVERLRQRMAGA